MAFIQRRHLEADTDMSRDRFVSYMREVPLPRLPRRSVEAAQFGSHDRGKSIAEVAAMPIGSCLDFLSEIKLEARLDDRRTSAQGGQ